MVASRDHALYGAKLGIVQANHGKRGPLKRMCANDQVLLYAPKKIYGSKEPYQRFVALAELKDNHIFQTEVSVDFKPFRRKAQYASVTEADIKPLIEELDFKKTRKAGDIYLDLVASR